MREVQLLVGGAVLAVPFVVIGWLEAWQVGACATVVMVVYAVCGWSALRARRAWQAEVAAERRRKRAESSLWSRPVNVRVIAPSVNSTPANPVFTGSLTDADVAHFWREDLLFCRECGEQSPGHLGSCRSSAMRDQGHPFHEVQS